MKETIWKIYKTTCLVNGKVYIGQTTLTGFRLEYYYGSGNSVYNAIKKYGKKFFVKEVLIICNNQMDADDYECLYIELFSSNNKDIGYNISSGGQFNPVGCKDSNETKLKKSRANKGKKLSSVHKQRISEAKIGKKLSDYHKECLSKAKKGKPKPAHLITDKAIEKWKKSIRYGEAHWFYGKHHSPEVAKKISDSHLGEKNHFYGRVHSDESKEKISIAKTGKRLSDAHREWVTEWWKSQPNVRARKVECYNKETGETIREFPTIQLAKEWCRGNVSKCLMGESKTAGGLPWRYCA